MLTKVSISRIVLLLIVQEILKQVQDDVDLGWHVDYQIQVLRFSYYSQNLDYLIKTLARRLC